MYWDDTTSRRTWKSARATTCSRSSLRSCRRNSPRCIACSWRSATSSWRTSWRIPWPSRCSAPVGRSRRSPSVWSESVTSTASNGPGTIPQCRCRRSTISWPFHNGPRGEKLFGVAVRVSVLGLMGYGAYRVGRFAWVRLDLSRVTQDGLRYFKKR